jgi:Cu2+-exporting ATPase
LATFDKAGLQPTILSGDQVEAVAEIARETGASAFAARLTPAEKLARIEAATTEGHRVLMVGDGINDAPALSAASVSIAPSTAADIGRNAADIVFTGADLSAVSTAWRVARKTRTIILQNFAIALGYNMIAVPLAIGGHVTPMIAAIAMSASSLAVTVNALRLGGTAR